MSRLARENPADPARWAHSGAKPPTILPPRPAYVVPDAYAVPCGKTDGPMTRECRTCTCFERR